MPLLPAVHLRVCLEHLRSHAQHWSQAMAPYSTLEAHSHCGPNRNGTARLARQPNATCIPSRAPHDSHDPPNPSHVPSVKCKSGAGRLAQSMTAELVQREGRGGSDEHGGQERFRSTRKSTHSISRAPGTLAVRCKSPFIPTERQNLKATVAFQVQWDGRMFTNEMVLEMQEAFNPGSPCRFTISHLTVGTSNSAKCSGKACRQVPSTVRLPQSTRVQQ